MENGLSVSCGGQRFVCRRKASFFQKIRSPEGKEEDFLKKTCRGENTKIPLPQETGVR
jgi:hypothetical protein